MNAALIVSFIFAQLAVGMYALVLWFDMRELGKYFFKFHATLFLLFLTISLTCRVYLHRKEDALSLGTMGAFAAFFIGIAALRWLWSKGQRPPLVEKATLIAGIVGLALDLASLFGALALTGGKLWLLAAAYPTGALLLSSVGITTILGHWYLVIPNLDIRNLTRMTAVFIAALAMRTVLFLLALGLFWKPYGEAAFFLGHRELMLDFGVFFWQRVLFGLLTPIGLSYMIWNTVKIRSTQSATGILYAAVLLILMGECLANYFLIRFGIPL